MHYGQFVHLQHGSSHAGSVAHLGCGVGRRKGASRYMIGVRFVFTAARAVDNPRDWSLGLGLEVEPIGALRYLLGIRSLY